MMVDAEVYTLEEAEDVFTTLQQMAMYLQWKGYDVLGGPTSAAELLASQIKRRDEKKAANE